MTKAPIDSLLDRVDWRCTCCGAKAGTCDCFVQCRCGWKYARGEKCANPKHRAEEADRIVAEGAARAAILSVREHYPEPLRFASGGFRKTLEQHIIREMLWALKTQREIESPSSPRQSDDA